jgi:hypothetical protein
MSRAGSGVYTKVYEQQIIVKSTRLTVVFIVMYLIYFFKSNHSCCVHTCTTRTVPGTTVPTWNRAVLYLVRVKIICPIDEIIYVIIITKYTINILLNSVFLSK